MQTYLQPVAVPERCFLQEVLYWVAFQRLPVSYFTNEGKEYRESDEISDYDIDYPAGDYLDEDETKRANIPPDPRWLAMFSDRSTPSLEFLEKVMLEDDLAPETRAKFENMRKDALEYQRACDEWMPHYEQAIEYPSARIFVELKNGRLRTNGRMLPYLDFDAARAALSADEQELVALPFVPIPSEFWSLKSISFNASAAWNTQGHFCHIYCRTDDMLTVFPGDNREQVVGVERIGGSYVPSRTAGKTAKTVARGPRGRPSYPWEAFHLEVATLVQRGELPGKKEAGIQHLQDWFQSALGIRPSRAAIGEKLKPYYDRFVTVADRKSNNH